MLVLLALVRRSLFDEFASNRSGQCVICMCGEKEDRKGREVLSPRCCAASTGGRAHGRIGDGSDDECARRVSVLLQASRFRARSCQFVRLICNCFKEKLSVCVSSHLTLSSMGAHSGISIEETFGQSLVIQRIFRLSQQGVAANEACSHEWSLAQEVLRRKLEESYDENQSSLKIEHLMKLFEFRQKTYFTCAGEAYEQMKGSPMGSPISGLVAELVLQELEKIAFTQ
ncbi:unnamed protein product [Schistocephalus solidus]|uniref:Reverse transcriptase domain-containing protein n=1 Tax=Schistocephalus solidus TaxID=70667 RepID=A0A183TG30_SCHSO|nr:unnamed protein product [Schistocephalus solidus]